jgi:hypothetical protein
MGGLRIQTTVRSYTPDVASGTIAVETDSKHVSGGSYSSTSATAPGAVSAGAGGSCVPKSGWVSSIQTYTTPPERNIRTAVARSTYEEHLRKAENKILTNAGQFMRLVTAAEPTDPLEIEGKQQGEQPAD